MQLELQVTGEPSGHDKLRSTSGKRALSYCGLETLSGAVSCRRAILVALLVAVLWIIHGVAQNTSGTILGTLSDQSGAELPGAEVTLANIANSDTRHAATDASGFYQLVNIPPGNYNISVTKSGFKTITRGPINLLVEGSLRIDLSMEIGSETQQVVVTAASPLIQAETASLGDVIDERETTELPLNGRDAMNLTALVPSVVAQGNTSVPSPTLGALGNYQIGGGMANQSSVYLDGSPDNTLYINSVAVVPTQDSIQEFKVDTSNLSPEYGHLAGGVINFSTKSGSHALHGNLWEYIRNKVLNSNDYFSKQAGLATPPFTMNQFGVNAGGPVVMPHLYDGRRKTFFFVNWEEFALRQGQTVTNTVPTTSERTGDLSALGTPIYDPLSTCGVANGPACAPGTPQYNRTQFANSAIPTDRLNPTALAYLNAFYPLPNTAGTNGVNNYTSNASIGGNSYQTVIRIDQNISDRQHVSARYTAFREHTLPLDPFRNGIVSESQADTNTNDFVLDDTYSINSKTILDMRLSYVRLLFSTSPTLSNFSLTTLGMPASLASEVQFPGPPTMNISGFNAAGTFNGNADSVISNANDMDRLAGSLTRFLGNHTLKFGGEFIRSTFNYVQNNISSGDFDFNNSFTAQNPLTGVGGLGLASFLLGYPADGSFDKVNAVASEQLYPGVFANDDWRATHNLTFHIGVRWENNAPWDERHNRLSYFDPNMVTPLLQAAQITNYPGAVELVDSATRSSRYSVDQNLKQFSPRLGVSYGGIHDTVLSAGYGIFWLPTDLSFQLSPNNDSINSFSTPYTASIDGGLTPANNITNPLPQSGIIPAPGRSSSYEGILLGNGVSEAFVNNPYAYAQQWNVDVQHQFGASVAVDVAYGAAKGTHLPFYSHQVDQLPDQDLTLGNQLLTPVPNPFYGIINSNYSLGSPTIPAGQLLRPYPQYNGVSSASAGQAGSTYNSLQVKVQKRFSAGASINVAYTFSKLLSNTDTLTAWIEPSIAGAYGGMQDSNNPSAEKSLSSDDSRNHLVVYYVYDIPVGRGLKYLSNAPTVVNYVLGGWGLEGITNVMDGFPLGFSTNQNLTNSFGGGSRPNYAPACDKNVGGSAVSKLNDWFNTSCFTQPTAFTFGNEPRNDAQLRAPGVANWDSSLFKKFPVDSEGGRFIEFRAEAFNLFNRVQFGYPGTGLGSSNFGVISSQQNSPRILQFALRFTY